MFRVHWIWLASMKSANSDQGTELQQAKRMDLPSAFCSLRNMVPIRYSICTALAADSYKTSYWQQRRQVTIISTTTARSSGVSMYLERTEESARIQESPKALIPSYCSNNRLVPLPQMTLLWGQTAIKIRLLPEQALRRCGAAVSGRE
jgi:hypothetical protein